MGAAVMVAHVATLWVTIRSDVDRRWKWLALVPVVTPVSAWKAGKRGATIAWVAILATYLVVRFLG